MLRCKTQYTAILAPNGSSINNSLQKDKTTSKLKRIRLVAPFSIQIQGKKENLGTLSPTPTCQVSSKGT